MLAVDFLELLDGVSGVFLRVEKIEALVVEPVGRFVGRRIVLFGEQVEAAAGAEARRHHRDSQHAREAGPARTPWLRGHVCGALGHGILGCKSFEHGPSTRTCRFPR
jgi:hypothetical protein